MKLYSIGQRSYIVDKTQVIKGGSYQAHDLEKRRLYINPKDKVEVTDEYGTKLMNMYKDQFMQLDGEGKVLETVKKTKKVKKIPAKKVVAKGKR
jgi:hypothetical protein